MKSKIYPIDPELANLIISTLDGVAITDAEGRYIYVNESWSRMMNGLSLDEVRGKFVKDIIPESCIYKVLESGEPIIGHGVKVRIGTDKDAFSSYYPIYKDGKLVAGFIHVIMTGMKSALEFTYRVNNLASQIEYLKKELKRLHGAKYTIENIIGESKPIQVLKDKIQMAALTKSNVVITGETGSGKELVAHAIHDLSSRSEAPLIKVNCAAIPTELLESEFFGYEEGAFTGALKGGKVGKFQIAEGGSLFLDEINQLPLQLQPKLLRALQEKEIEPIGAKESISFDVRLIVATNESLEKLISEKKFRSDLYYRLNVININIPPLRERKSDIPLLAKAIVDRLNFQLGMLVEGISDEALCKLEHYDWFGNVRELQNVIERAMNISHGQILEWKHFKDYFESRKAFLNHECKCEHQLIKLAKEDLERDILQNALAANNFNKTQTAKSIGISRTMLYKKLRKYNIL